MKKTFILVLLTAAIVSQLQAMTVNAIMEEKKEIEIKETTIQPRPRTPSFQTFTASYNFEILTINSSDYIGNVQVTITGDNTLIYSYSVSGTHTEYIDISTLGEGSYTLTMITSGSTYTGEFEL